MVGKTKEGYHNIGKYSPGLGEVDEGKKKKDLLLSFQFHTVRRGTGARERVCI